MLPKRAYWAKVPILVFIWPHTSRQKSQSNNIVKLLLTALCVSLPFMREYSGFHFSIPVFSPLWVPSSELTSKVVDTVLSQKSLHTAHYLRSYSKRIRRKRDHYWTSFKSRYRLPKLYTSFIKANSELIIATLRLIIFL